MGKALSDDVLRSAYEAVQLHGALLTAARAIGMPEKTLLTRYERALQRFGLPDIRPPRGRHAKHNQKPEAAPEPTRREVHDATFWRRKAANLGRELAAAELAAEELAGIRSMPVQVPDWLIPAVGNASRAVLGLLVSDVHAGEVVSSDEILGLNAYDPDICRRRLRRYFAAACTIGPRWGADCVMEGAMVALAGDLISGDIHEELRITNGLTSHEQVALVVEEITAGLLHVADTFGRVHVVSVPGNHGRTTPKPTAKLYARLSYDTLAARMIAERLKADDRFTWQIGASTDAVVPVLGRTVFVTHGDRMGTGGGQGFIGPMAPIVRGTKKVEAQQARANRRPDLILHGHFHTSAQPGPVLSNGSIPAYTEYGNGLRATMEPPQQWLFLMHARWGLRERAEIVLDDPAPPPKPRVTIPAVMQSAGTWGA